MSPRTASFVNPETSLELTDLGERRSESRLLDPDVIRLGELDKSAKTPPLLGAMVVMNVGEAVIEKGV
jgi:hypothetical protein